MLPPLPPRIAPTLKALDSGNLLNHNRTLAMPRSMQG